MGMSNQLIKYSIERPIIEYNFNTGILRGKKNGHPKVSFYIPGSKWLYI